MPHFSHTEVVAAEPAAVFAILDDTSRTPEWLERCTQIEKLSEGPNQVGTQLRYHYRDGRRTGVMNGSIVVHNPGRQITMAYLDRMMDVTVDFVTEPAGAGTTRLTHTIDITPQGFFKLLTPLIKRSLPGQTRDAMDRLKDLAQQPG